MAVERVGSFMVADQEFYRDTDEPAKAGYEVAIKTSYSVGCSSASAV